MTEDRGLGIEALRRWVLTQSCPDQAFQIVLVFDQESRKLEGHARALLRPWDEVVFHSGHSRAQYQAAACAATGGVLIFTEAHCLPRDGNVDRVIEAFGDPSISAACGRTEPIATNSLGSAEAHIWREDSIRWSDPSVWAKVNVHTFCIRRTVLSEVGGFPHEYDGFAEDLLAARLRSHGYPIHYLPDVSVEHCEAGVLAFHDESIGRYVRGECQFRLDCDSPDFVQEHFGEPPEWVEALGARTANLSAIAGSLVRRIVAPPGRQLSPLSRTEAVAELAGLLALRGVAPWWLLARTRFALSHQRARLLLARNASSRVRALREYRRLTARLHRQRFALQLPAFALRPYGDSPITYSLDQLNTQDLSGFFPVEWLADRSFRWSGRVASVRLRLPTSAIRGNIRLVPIRPVDPTTELALFIDGVRVHPERARDDIWTITFAVPRRRSGDPSDRWLVLHASPWREALQRGADARHLGLPIESVIFQTE